MHCSCALLILCFAPADAQTFADSLVKPFLADKPYLALTVGIVTPTESQVFGYGEADFAGQKKPPDGDTVFALGSLTKAYTGILLADAVRAGKVVLDDPAQKHLPADLVLPKRGDKTISILDLATHYSGLPVQPENLGWRNLLRAPAGSGANPYAHYDRKRLAKELPEVELENDPGSTFEYSNLGTGLLGHALANVLAAESYEAALKARVCDPLGLPDTRIALSDAQKARLAPGFSKAGKSAPHWQFATLEACGALFSTANDQVRFLKANMGMTPSPLSAAMTDSHAARRQGKSPDHRIGLGWHTIPLRPGSKHSIVWHNGGTFAARCFLGFVPDAKVGVVVLSNSANSVDPLAIELLRKLVPE